MALVSAAFSVYPAGVDHHAVYQSERHLPVISTTNTLPEVRRIQKKILDHKTTGRMTASEVKT
jgi:hypothetical protein